jgi:hypothetical protein
MVQASEFLNWFNPVPGGQNATPAAIAEARAYAEALQKPTAPGQSGPYQAYGKWSALADALRSGIGGYTQYAANQAERANLGAAAGSIPGLGNTGAAPQASATPSLTSPSGIPPQAEAGETNPNLAARRARFAQELDADPALRQHMLAVSAGENLDPTANLSVMESAMNRADMMGTSLAQEMRHTSQGGYYAGYNPAALNDPGARAIMEKNLQTALGGSNASKFATDNASGNFAAERVAKGMYAPNSAYGGESFLHPQGRDARGHDKYGEWLQSVAGPQANAAPGGAVRTAMAAPAAMTDAGPAAPGAPGVMPVSQPAPQMPTGPAQQMMLGGGGVTMPPAGSGSPSGPAVPPGVQPRGIQSMMPPLPSDEQIRAMYYRGAMAGDPHLQQQAQQLYEQKRQSLQPQIMATPTGHQIAFNPYQGAQDIGIPTKPMMEKFNTKVTGVGEFERPAAYSIDQNGTPFLQRIPIAGPGQAPGQAGAPPAPMGPTPTSSGYTPAGMSAVTPAAAASGGLGMNIGPGGAPTSNSQLFGEQAGPSAAGTMPDLDKASIPELQAWGARREAEQKGLDTASESVWKSRAELHGAAISALKTIPSEMQQLAILQDAYKQPHIPGGPLAEAWSSGRALIKEVFGPKAADEVPASQVIEKTNTALSFKAAGELTSRPALIEVLAAMRANPGLKMTDQSSLYLINLMQQQKAQELQLGHMANEADNPREFISARSKFYQEHPLLSPFTGKPLQTAADFKADLDKTVANSEPHGLGGSFMSKLGGAGQAAPQGAPAAPPAGAPMQIKDDAGYNALPSGASFVGPDGHMRRKP